MILLVFCVLLLLSLAAKTKIQVNYDMNSYLPKDSPSTVSLDKMKEEFSGGIPNARVMIKDVSLTEALSYKEKLLKIDGVSDVTWLDDVVDLTVPLETQEEDTISTYYKDGNALFLVTIEEEKNIEAVADIRKLIGNDNAMTGSAVSTAVATNSTVSEIKKIAVIGVLFTFFVLMLTTTSWAEPIVVLIGLGFAVAINAGSNLIFGEISFVTNAAGNILQLAVSLDYSVFLIHRFEECRKQEHGTKEEAMLHALTSSTSSILSSGLTTVIGFLALTLMRFQIGPDLGFALAKGIAISLLTVFLFMPGVILLFCDLMDKTKHRPFLPSFRRFGRVIQKITLPLCVIFLLLIAPSYLASVQNDYYFGASHIFGKGTTLGDDTAAIEDSFGKSDTYVLLVKKGDTATETELSDALHKIKEVSSIISFVDQAGAEVPYDYVDSDTLKKLESDHYSRMVLTVKAAYEGEETFSLVEKIRETAEHYYPDSYYLAGEGVSTYDLMDTVTADMQKVNLLAIGAVFVVLLLTMCSLVLPVILVATIETAVWINMSIPYYLDQPIFYIAYLIISSVQLGATVDYAILLTNRYYENRQTLSRKDSIVATLSHVTASILTSGTVLTVVGFLLGKISTHGLLSQLGYLLGKGTICSLLSVLFVLPGLLIFYDWIKEHLTRKKQKGGISHE